MGKLNFPEDTSIVKMLQDLSDRLDRLERNSANYIAPVAYTPTFTNFTLGDGSIDFQYIRTNGLVYVFGVITMGASSVISGAITWTHPIDSVAGLNTRLNIGYATLYDSGTEAYFGVINWQSTTTAWVRVLRPIGSLLAATAVSSSNPMTWAVGDQMVLCYSYPAGS